MNVVSVQDQICVYHGRRYGTRAPLCETKDCPNVGSKESEEWGNDGKQLVTVLRCAICYPIAQEKVREMEEFEESRRQREKPL